MDIIDVAQRRQQDEIDQLLASRRPAGVGTAHCVEDDCGEPIAHYRQQLGATLCIDCQQRAERKAQQCARTAV